jgi:PEP-CTERM motif
MPRIVVTLAAALFVSSGGWAVSPAAASPILVPLLDPGVGSTSLVIGNLQITVGQCHITDASVSSQACGVGNDLYLEGVTNFVPGSHPTVTVTIQKGDGSTPIFDELAGDPNTYDLSVDLTVATIAGQASIKSNALAVNGSTADSSNLTSLTTGETVVDGSYNFLGYMTASAAGPPQQLDFAPVNTVQVLKDISDSTSGGAGTGAMVLSSVSQTFGQVPEPASIALLLTGMAALGVFRRRLR